jgi:hypothetical protein
MKTNTDSGFFYAPYNPFRPVTWQKKLMELELKFASWLKIGNVSRECGLVDVNEMMQAWYPGPYRVVEKYLPDRMVFGFVLEFNDPKEKTVWLLRWS